VSIIGCHPVAIQGSLFVLEDALSGKLLIGLGLGATALLLPKVMPDLSPQLRSAVKTGISIFLEAESEAEGGIIARLADSALKQVLDSLSAPGSDPQKHQNAADAVDRFKRTARRRAGRYDTDEANQSARYRRHVTALERRIRKAREARKEPPGGALQHLEDRLSSETFY
jgi:hypothetical protein